MIAFSGGQREGGISLKIPMLIIYILSDMDIKIEMFYSILCIDCSSVYHLIHILLDIWGFMSIN